MGKIKREEYNHPYGFREALHTDYWFINDLSAGLSRSGIAKGGFFDRRSAGAFTVCNDGQEKRQLIDGPRVSRKDHGALS